MPLITFLKEEFQLKIHNLREYSSRYGTTIAVVLKYFDNVISNIFVTQFSFCRPIITVISLEAVANIIKVGHETVDV